MIEFAKRETCTHVLYACTHYPLVADVFTQVAKELSYQGEFVNPAKCVESKVPHVHGSVSHQDVFVTTKNTEVFKKYSGNHTVFVFDL